VISSVHIDKLKVGECPMPADKVGGTSIRGIDQGEMFR